MFSLFTFTSDVSDFLYITSVEYLGICWWICDDLHVFCKVTEPFCPVTLRKSRIETLFQWQERFLYRVCIWHVKSAVIVFLCPCERNTINVKHGIGRWCWTHCAEMLSCFYTCARVCACLCVCVSRGVMPNQSTAAGTHRQNIQMLMYHPYSSSSPKNKRSEYWISGRVLLVQFSLSESIYRCYCHNQFYYW